MYVCVWWGGGGRVRNGARYGQKNMLIYSYIIIIDVVALPDVVFFVKLMFTKDMNIPALIITYRCIIIIIIILL